MSGGMAYFGEGIGMLQTGYQAWSKGEQYERDADAYVANTYEDIKREQESFKISESAKDVANVGAFSYLDSYMYQGKQKLNNIAKQLTNINTSLLLQNNIVYEQSLAVDETVGNMMSRNAIDAMKAEARLRAAAAGTGTTGGTTQSATHDAEIVEMFDNAVLIGRATSQKVNLARRMQMERLSAKNQKAYSASKLSQVFGADGAGAAWQQGYAKSYAGLPNSLKSGYISHDKIQPKQVHTWVDDLIEIKDTAVKSGLDVAVADMLNGWGSPTGDGLSSTDGYAIGMF